MCPSNATLIENREQNRIEKTVYLVLLYVMEKDDTMKETYTKTYIENGAGNRLLVAPMISGSQVLDLLGFAKQGDIYPDLAEKQVTDIG